MSVDEIADRLYGLPLEEFTQARNLAERELRKAGQRQQADDVKALRKPTATAGAVNRLVRGHRAEVEAFLETATTLRDAQFAGKGDLAAAAKAERAALDELVSLADESVRMTLEAAAVDDDVAQELLAARLVREPEPAGFGTLLSHAGPPPAGSATAKSGSRPAGGKAKPDDTAARARLQEAREVLRAAKTEEQQARHRWTRGATRNAEGAGSSRESTARP